MPETKGYALSGSLQTGENFQLITVHGFTTRLRIRKPDPSRPVAELPRTKEQNPPDEKKPLGLISGRLFSSAFSKRSQ
jgi:hypothetical protein